MVIDSVEIVDVVVLGTSESKTRSFVVVVVDAEVDVISIVVDVVSLSPIFNSVVVVVESTITADVEPALEEPGIVDVVLSSTAGTVVVVVTIAELVSLSGRLQFEQSVVGMKSRSVQLSVAPTKDSWTFCPLIRQNMRPACWRPLLSMNQPLVKSVFTSPIPKGTTPVTVVEPASCPSLNLLREPSLLSVRCTACAGSSTKTPRPSTKVR